jgi:hypothetical protein
MPKLTLTILPDQFAVCMLSPDADIPAWSRNEEFYSITRSRDELSIVCLSKDVPENIRAECDWRALKVRGPLEFSLTGILAAIINPLSEAKIPIFAISTYDTDYILIREDSLSQVVAILSGVGYSIDQPARQDA